MKYFKIQFLVFCIAFAVVSCKSNNENGVESGNGQNENVQTTDKIAANDSISDYKKLKSYSEKLITDNDAKIEGFKNKLRFESKENRAKFQSEIDSLISKNKMLKNNLDSLKLKSIDKWKSFKRGYKKVPMT